MPRRLLWFAALYGMGVGVTLAVAEVLRLVLAP